MRKRSSEIGSGSFDLFLDTVCNTFGGIVFMAILLAVLIQTRAVLKTPETTEKTPVSADELRELLTQLDSAAATHAELARALAETPPVVLTEDGEVYRDLIEEQASLEAEFAYKTQTKFDVTKQAATLLGTNSELQAEIAALPTAIEQAKADIAATRSNLASLIDSRQTTLRLPREQSSNASASLLLVRNNRVYVAKSANRSGFDETQVDVTKTFGGGNTLKPRPGSRWPIRDRRVADLIRQAGSGRSIITLAIWPESYGDFAELKASMIESQVRYQLWPQKKDETLVVFLGGGTSSVQ